MSDDVIDVLVPSKAPSRTIASAGRRARPAFTSPLQAEASRQANTNSHSVAFSSSPSPTFSEGSDPESDGSDDEEELPDVGEMRRKFFEGLVAEWKSRRNTARPRVTTDTAHTLPSYYGHALGSTKPNKLAAYHNHILNDGAGRAYTATVQLPNNTSNSGNSNNTNTNAAVSSTNTGGNTLTSVISTTIAPASCGPSANKNPESSASAYPALTPAQQQLWTWVPSWTSTASNTALGTGKNTTPGYTSTLMTFPDNSASSFLNDTNSTIPSSTTTSDSTRAAPSLAASLSALSARAQCNHNAYALYHSMLAMPTAHVNISAYAHPQINSNGYAPVGAGKGGDAGADEDRISVLSPTTPRTSRSVKDDAFSLLSATQGPIVADVAKQIFASEGGNQIFNNNSNGSGSTSGNSRGNTKSGNASKHPTKFPTTCLQFSASPPSLSPLLSSPAVPQPLLFRCHLSNTIRDVFYGKGWTPSDSETQWTIGWVGRPWVRGVYSKIHLDPYQRVNHFRNFFELTRKDALAKNVKRLRRVMQIKERDLGKESKDKEKDKDKDKNIVVNTSTEPSPLVLLPPGSLYSPLLAENQHIPENYSVNFIPETFILPKEYKMFLEAFKKSTAPSWIMKPVARCQGQGIFLFDKLRAVQDWARANANASSTVNTGNSSANAAGNAAESAEVYVVQEYIANPLVVGGKKFDMRIYVLVSSFNPLTVWLCREGFGRFSGSRFSMTEEDRGNNYVHLTNVAVQKGGQGYDDDSGGKWDIRSIKLHIASTRGRQAAESMMVSIQDAILKSLLSVQDIMVNDETSFALYGFDIMLDSDLRAWVIEVNACPSLTANTPHDYYLKYCMLSDAMAIIDPDGSRARRENQVGCWDVLYRGDKVVVGVGGIGRRPLMSVVEELQRDFAGVAAADAGRDKDVRLIGNLDYLWREKQNSQSCNPSGRVKPTTSGNSTAPGNNQLSMPSRSACAAWLEQSLPQDMYLFDRFLAGYADYPFARSAQTCHVMAAPAFTSPADANMGSDGMFSAQAPPAAAASSPGPSVEPASPLDADTASPVIAPAGNCVFGVAPRLDAQNNARAGAAGSSTAASSNAKPQNNAKKPSPNQRQSIEDASIPNGLAIASSVIPSILASLPPYSTSPLLLPLPSCVRPASALPLYTQGPRIHANLPMSVALVDAASAPVSALAQYSLLGSHNDRLVQLPYMYAAIDCFNIIYNDITSTSSSSANANEATALAVGLRPPVAKRPIFK